MNANSKVRSLNCPSGIKGVIEVFEDTDQTVRYSFWGYDTFDKFTPEDIEYIVKFVKELTNG